MGLPSLHGYRKGDQYLHVRVEVPVRLNKDQAELLKKFASTLKPNQSPGNQTFWQKVKSILGL